MSKEVPIMLIAMKYGFLYLLPYIIGIIIVLLLIKKGIDKWTSKQKDS